MLNHANGWMSSWMPGWMGVVTLAGLMVAVLVMAFLMLYKMHK